MSRDLFYLRCYAKKIIIIYVVLLMLVVPHFATDTLVLAICIFLVSEPSCYYHYISSIGEVQVDNVDRIAETYKENNLATIAAHNPSIFENLAKQFDNIAKRLEYSVDLSGKQIFPNDTIKEDVVTHYRSSTFTINTLKYTLLGFDITASDIRIKVEPSRIDTTTTKVDLPIVVARDVSIAKGLIDLKYDQINLSSIYGIYDKTSDKMTIHIPLSVALRYLPRSFV
jgi:hypothetical protein